MRISVFGLGYVGTVSAACLAAEGHQVVGVDINPEKVEALNDGRSPVIEERLPELVAEEVSKGRLKATTDPTEAVHQSDLSLICVGTPSLPNGNLDLSAVERTCEQIGEALAGRDSPHIVVIRSTVLPGSTRSVVIPALEDHSRRRLGEGLKVCVNPEFLREGSSVADFYEPPFILIGEGPAGGADEVARLYARLRAPVFVETLEVAEMVKYACNAFHALKVAFANEIGSIAKSLGCDGSRVMEILCQDGKLNISPRYLRPGFAFGGSCLPKDLRALVYRARSADVPVPLLEAVLPSNQQQIQRALSLIMELARPTKRVGFMGLSFKAGTDDLRESPAVILVETLLGKGYQVAVHDHNVSLSRLVGANRRYIESEIPHIAALMRPTPEAVIEASEVLVIATADPAFLPHLRDVSSDKKIVDLVHLVNDPGELAAEYHGINW